MSRALELSALPASPVISRDKVVWWKDGARTASEPLAGSALSAQAHRPRRTQDRTLQEYGKQT